MGERQGKTYERLYNLNKEKQEKIEQKRMS